MRHRKLEMKCTHSLHDSLILGFFQLRVCFLPSLLGLGPSAGSLLLLWVLLLPWPCSCCSLKCLEPGSLRAKAEARSWLLEPWPVVETLSEVMERVAKGTRLGRIRLVKVYYNVSIIFYHSPAFVQLHPTYTAFTPTPYLEVRGRRDI